MMQRLRVFGIVQGVGFRPFVDRIAVREGIAGSVSNKGPYVEIFAKGSPSQLDEFRRALTKEAPERSSILKVETTDLEADDWPADAAVASGIDASGRGFAIVESEREEGAIFVSPDIAVCDACKEELFDPTNRRYLHPFINCTACGPRVTILDSMPYDRERTSMGEFPMCPECAREYTDPASRRYDAQPVCCNDCGPEVFTLPSAVTGDPGLRGGEAIIHTRDVIRGGGIAAIKGIGGFHLCCDATNEQAVARLRTLKARPFKPFAVMLRDIDVVRRECRVLPGQEAVLDGPSKPILLLDRRDPSGGGPAPRIAPSVAPDNPTIGVMLPYAPVQLLIFDYPDGRPMSDCLVMTSANPKGAPICRDDEDVRTSLGDMCDVVLTHDRTIRLRADDSVMAWHDGSPYMVRRSRGYAPLPLMLDDSMAEAPSVLAVGGELKNTFCLTKGALMYMAPYVGDLSDARSVEALRQAVGRMAELLEITPALVACDMHPLYNSRALAYELATNWDVPVVEIQHHYAHVLSCMAENGRRDQVIGVSFDGTGYGCDGSVWGGEFLLSTTGSFERLGHVATFAQAGGDLAAREGWRVAVALLLDACATPEEARDLAIEAGVCDARQFGLVSTMIASGINTVASSSVGRVFDAVSAVLGLRRSSTCEGEAAMVLQFAAERYAGKGTTAGGAVGEDGMVLTDGPILVPAEPGGFAIPLAHLVAELAEAHADGIDTDLLAYEFHRAMAAAVVAGCQECRRLSGCSTVALSGGVMQNTLLLAMCERGLEGEGFEVLRHGMYPTNDGGIALGQALYGMGRAPMGDA